MKKFFIQLSTWIRTGVWTTSDGPLVGESTDPGQATKTIHPVAELSEPHPLSNRNPSKNLFASAKPKGFFKNGKAKKPMTSREMYLEQWGIIPKDKVVYHIDGDETNFHITNLGVIHRSHLINLNIHDK